MTPAAMHAERRARISAIYPHCDPHTLSLRTELAVAEEVLQGALADLDGAPGGLAETLAMAGIIAGRASRSNWPETELKQALHAVKCAYFCCTGLARLLEDCNE